MFMVMDDIGWLIWRFGRKVIVSSEDDDHAEGVSQEGGKPQTGSTEKRAAAAE
jgi:hypothetical protein